MTFPDPKRSSRIRLIEAAILCFSEKGYDAVGIREIAMRAKANSSLIQYHFGGKAGIYAEALRHIFSSRPMKLPALITRSDKAEARETAIQSIGALVEIMLGELMSCTNGSDLDRAGLKLITRELQDPREHVTGLILEHMRPLQDRLMTYLKVLRPDLDGSSVEDHMKSIFSQVIQLHTSFALIQSMRDEPDYPGDLRTAVAHLTEFSLRGIGIPEPFPGA